ncbi:MAG: NTP transferase domain-containing protein [Elusimicrobia bacterium]|nr:NTP transferase domain-containing protein [Elusimicrobiota bacterium]
MILAGLPVAVLCGGLGTRLREAVRGRQKVLADVEGRPFIDVVVGWARGQGLRRFVFCTGYKGDDVRGHLRSRFPGLDMAFSREPRPLGTAGALRRCRPLLGGGPALVLNGDSFCPIRLADFVAFHRRRAGAASLAAVGAGARRDGGAIRVGDSSRIVSFEEKPVCPAFLINAGIYLLEPAVWDALPDRRPCSLEKEVFSSLIPAGLYAYVSRSPLYDIGTPERLEEFRRRARRWEARRGAGSDSLGRV